MTPLPAKRIEFNQMAMAFEIKSVTPETLHLNSFTTEKEITWRHVAEPPGPANRSQPIGSETNRTLAPVADLFR